MGPSKYRRIFLRGPEQTDKTRKQARDAQGNLRLLDNPNQFNRSMNSALIISGPHSI